MKVALITRHAVFNYGSLLQTIATQKCLEDMGHDCQVIDYIRQDEDYRNIADTLLQTNPKWNRNFATRCVYKLLQSPKFRIMGRHFEKMRKDTVRTTKKYSSYAQLCQDKPEADCYLTGSDQVWGPIGKDLYDPAYFLGFTGEADRRVSYAASFGKTEFSEALLEEFSGYLKRYDSVMVREKSAVEIISDMGVPVQQVLDPTLLLDKDYWSQYIVDKFPKDYILIYQLHNNPQMVEYAYTLSQKTGLPLVSMSAIAGQLAHSGSKHVFLPSLSQWLGYIQNAKFMITDSFHGTAFAMNFNTQFVNVLPKGTSTRNRSILQLTGLEDRVVTDYEDFSCFDRQIDYSYVNQVIAENRKASLEIFRNNLTPTKECL